MLSLVVLVACEDGTRRIIPLDTEAVADGDVIVTGDEDMLLVEGADDPLNDDGVPVNDDGVPVNDDGVPVNDDGVPVNDDGVPVNDDGEPVNDDGEPVNDDGEVTPDIDIDNAPCSPNDTRQIPCGINGAGLQSQICIGSDWQNQGICVDDDVCKNGEEQDIACGINNDGIQSQDCVDGQWVNDGACVDDDVCENGTEQTIPCGDGGKGDQAQDCVDGQWVNDGDCVMPSQTGRWTCNGSKQCVPEYGYAACGNGTCDPKNGESAKSCPADCDKAAVNGKDQNCSDIYDCAFYGWFESTPGYWGCGGYPKKCTVNKSTTYCDKTGYDYCYAGTTVGIETDKTCSADCANTMLNQNAQTGCNNPVDCIFLDWPENNG